MRIALHKEGCALISVTTNADGRCGAPILVGDSMVPGSFELHFHVGAYFSELGVNSPFLEVVPVRFRVEEGQSYHVPLVCSPRERGHAPDRWSAHGVSGPTTPA